MEQILYVKTDGGLPKRVFYYFDDSGQEKFEEKRIDKAQFSQFTPSEEEKQIARQIRDEASKEGGILRLHYEGKLLVIDWGR